MSVTEPIKLLQVDSWADGSFWYGESAIATVLLGGGATPIPTPFGAIPGQINSGFTLNYLVPEPASAALLTFGLAAMVVCRRRG